jgi:CHASE3 domain sensor protein
MNGNFLKRSEKAIMIVFIAVPLLVAILVFLFLKQMYLDQQQGLTLVKHSYEVREQLLELRNDLIQSESGQSIFLLTGSHSYLQPSLFAASDAFVRLQYLSVLLADRPVGGKSWFRFVKGFGFGRKRTANLARISRRKPTGPNQRHYPRNAGR